MTGIFMDVDADGQPHWKQNNKNEEDCYAPKWLWNEKKTTAAREQTIVKQRMEKCLFHTPFHSLSRTLLHHAPNVQLRLAM